MIKITSPRIEGKGRGTEIGFPTINFSIEELIQGLSIGLSIGLWAGVSTEGRLIALISKSKSGFRAEIHILTKRNIKVKPGESLTICLLEQLRPYERIKNIQETIKKDKELGEQYFKSKSTCFGCQLYYVKDYGYSNYTVNGTTHGCFMKIYEEYETEWHETSDITAHTGIKCKYKVPGECWEFDVDGNNPAPTKEWIDSAIRNAKLNRLLNE